MSHRLPAFLALLLLVPLAVAAPPAGRVETKFLESKVLADNRVGLNLHRSLKVYLPPGYAAGKSRYPVIYMLHGLNWSNERMFAPDSTIASTFDTAIARGVIRPFIAVAPDYTAAGPGTFYVNSTTAWWVLFNPIAAAVIEVCFLNGNDTPAVLAAGPDFQFDKPGISLRGTMPSGATQQNFRGGVYNVGA